MHISCFLLLFSYIICSAMDKPLAEKSISKDGITLARVIKDKDVAALKNMLISDDALILLGGLHHAAQHASHKCMRVLLAYGVDPNEKTEQGNTPFHCVKTVKGAELLLKAGALVNVKNAEGNTPLSHVLFNAFFEGSRHSQEPFAQNPLYRQRYDIAQVLLNNGADINDVDTNDDTFLHHAVNQKNKNIIDFLLHNNCNTRKRNHSDLTAFELAVREHTLWFKHKKILDVFEKYGMVFFPGIKPHELLHIPKETTWNYQDVRFVASFNNWARLLACTKKNYTHNIRSSGVICDHYGCRVNSLSVKDFEHYFGEKGKIAVMSMLSSLNQHAVLCIKQCCPDELQDLIRQFPLITTYGSKRAYTLMTEAIMLKNSACLNVLIKNNIDCHQRILYGDRNECDGGGTFLHYAVFCDNPKAIDLLVEHGVDVLQENGYGKTPLEYAIILKREKCAQLLNKIVCREYEKDYLWRDYRRSKEILPHIVDCNAYISEDGYSLLHSVAIGNAHRAVKTIPLLIAKGADINPQQGETALWRLIGCGAKDSYPVFKILLSAGARVNKGKNPLDFSLLTLALFKRDYILAQLFLEYGAIVDKEMLIKKYKKIPQELTLLLEQKYNEQECCVCLENPDDLSDIPFEFLKK